MHFWLAMLYKDEQKDRAFDLPLFVCDTHMMWNPKLLKHFYILEMLTSEDKLELCAANERISCKTFACPWWLMCLFYCHLLRAIVSSYIHKMAHSWHFIPFLNMIYRTLWFEVIIHLSKTKQFLNCRVSITKQYRFVEE